MRRGPASRRATPSVGRPAACAPCPTGLVLRPCRRVRRSAPRSADSQCYCTDNRTDRTSCIPRSAAPGVSWTSAAETHRGARPAIGDPAMRSPGEVRLAGQAHCGRQSTCCRELVHAVRLGQAAGTAPHPNTSAGPSPLIQNPRSLAVPVLEAFESNPSQPERHRRKRTLLPNTRYRRR